MYVWTMCTSTLLLEDGVMVQPAREMSLVTVVLSGIATSASFVPEQPAGLLIPSVNDVEWLTEGEVPVNVIG